MSDKENVNNKKSNDAEVVDKPHLKHLDLYKSALRDIANDRFADGEAALDGTNDFSIAKQLREKAKKLNQHLAQNGVLPSAPVWAQMIATVDEYFRLLGFIDEGQALTDKQIQVELRTQNGVEHSISSATDEFTLDSSVKSLQAAIDNQLGSVARQLLSSGRPVTGAAAEQSLYQLAVSSSSAVELREGRLRLQEVVRTVSG